MSIPDALDSRSAERTVLPLYDGLINELEAIEQYRADAHRLVNTLQRNTDLILTDRIERDRMQKSILSYLDARETIVERFECILQPEFVPYVSSISLGGIHFPDTLARFQEFEAECGRLIDALDTQDNSVTRFASNDPDSDLSYTSQLHQTANGDHVVVVTRSRRLAEFHDHEYNRTIKIRKRMTFLLTDLDMYRDNSTTNSATNSSIQYYVDDKKLQHGLHEADSSIIPISTVYVAYAKFPEKEDSKS